MKKKNGHPQSDISIKDIQEEQATIDMDASKFPIAIFPDWVRQYLIEVCEALPCPTDFIGTFLLATFSGLINNSRKIKIKESWEESALLYLAVIAEPSSKKSPAMDKALLPIYHLQKEKDRVYKKELADFETNGGSKPNREIFYLEDSTVEAIAVALSNQKRGFVYPKDELSGWISEMNQYKGKGGGDRAFWLSNWSGKRVSQKRVKSDLFLPDKSYVTVVGAIQPDLVSCLSNGKRDGFENRLLFSYPAMIKRKYSEKDVSQEVSKIFLDNCLFLHNKMIEEPTIDQQKETTLRISPQGKKIWTRFMYRLYEKIDEEKNMLVKASLGKMDGYTARFALIIELTNYPESEQVSETSVKLAIRLAEYFIHNMRKTLSVVSGEKVVKTRHEAVDKIKELGGKVTPRIIYKKMRKLGYKNKEDALRLINELEEKGFGEITHEAPKSGGAKATFFTLFND